MSEELKQQEAPQVRTIDEIKAEYSNLCAQAGDLQYRITCFREDVQAMSEQLAQINARQKEINQEGAALLKAQQAVQEARENN